MAYIGQSCDVARRIKEHQRSSHMNTLIDYDIKMEGMQNFTFEIIEECLNEQLNEREKYWIKYYDTYYNGYNNTPGGKGRPVITPKEEQQILHIIIVKIILLHKLVKSLIARCLALEIVY